VSGYRVVFVVRRFWPQWDGASRTIGALAASLVDRGWEATVLAVGERPQWPSQLRWRGVRVVRLPWNQAGCWGEFRYMRSLGRWLGEHRGSYDLVYVSSLRHDAYAALGAVGDGVPVVLRAETAGRRGDCLWQLDARCGRRIKRRTMKAAALLGPSAPAHRELIAAGYPRERIHHIVHGVAVQPERDHAARQAARRALAAEQPTLMLADETPLALFAGWLRPGRGLLALMAAWERVVARRPKARLWLAGGGPQQAAIQRAVDARRLANRVMLVGRFDEVDTLLAAADLFVLPAAEEDLSVALLEAMAAGLPPVVCDNTGNREAVESERQGLLVPPANPAALAAAIGQLIDQPSLARRLGAAAQRRVEQHFSLAKMVEAHVTLFEDLLA